MNKYFLILFVVLIAFASCIEEECVDESRDACIKSSKSDSTKCCWYEVGGAIPTCVSLPADNLSFKLSLNSLKLTGKVDCGANYFKVFTVAIFAFVAIF